MNISQFLNPVGKDDVIPEVADSELVAEIVTGATDDDRELILSDHEGEEESILPALTKQLEGLLCPS